MCEEQGHRNETLKKSFGEGRILSYVYEVLTHMSNSHMDPRPTPSLGSGSRHGEMRAHPSHHANPSV